MARPHVTALDPSHDGRSTAGVAPYMRRTRCQVAVVREVVGEAAGRHTIRTVRPGHLGGHRLASLYHGARVARISSRAPCLNTPLVGSSRGVCRTGRAPSPPDPDVVGRSALRIRSKAALGIEVAMTRRSVASPTLYPAEPDLDSYQDAVCGGRDLTSKQADGTTLRNGTLSATRGDHGPRPSRRRRPQPRPTGPKLLSRAQRLKAAPAGVSPVVT